MTLAHYFRSLGHFTHVFVADKFLQDQYLTAFPQDLKIVKGRGNFPCIFPVSSLDDFFTKRAKKESGTTKLTCAEAPCTELDDFGCMFKPSVVTDDNGKIYRNKHGVVRDWDETAPPGCEYWRCKDNAIHNDITIHNYHYFMYEHAYAHEFTPRYLGIFDEAHLIESLLMGFVEERFASWAFNRITRYLAVPSITIPFYTTLSDWVSWLDDIHKILTTDILPRFGDIEAKDIEQTIERKSILDLVKSTIERIAKLKVDMSLSPDNWVSYRNENTITFKPVTIHQYSNKYLFQYTNKRVLMSATILDGKALARYLGLGTDIAFVRVPKSTFPPTNRPFRYDFVGKATYNSMKEYLPKLLEELDNRLIPQNLEYKGVIHTHTNDIAKYIVNNSKYKDVMMTNTFSPLERTEVFEQFFDEKPPKIMVSASMNTGVDLYDDRCRWQVLCKVPYPSLGDPQIKRRVDQDQTWYVWQTIMTLVQTYGRGCRSDTDWCNTYMLDSKFADVYNRYQYLFPNWFKEAVRIIW